MLDEAKKWSRVDDHPYIASVLDWGFDSIPWVAVEYIDGGPLTAQIEEQSLTQRLWTAYAVADAVAYASGQHGITHHDLKPQNILFYHTPEGTWDIPKIVDWGLSRELIQHTGSISQATPEYAAPEQFAALMPETPVGIHTDVYQLGVVCYEMLTGEHPNHLGGDVPRPSSIKPSIPDAVDSAITQALTHDRGDRIDHPILFREALQDALEEQIVSQSSDGPNVTTNRVPQQGSSNENLQRDQPKREAIRELTTLNSVDEPDAYQLITTGIRSIATLTNRNERAVSMAVDRSATTVVNWINEADAHAATHQPETEDDVNSIAELLDQSSKSDTVSQSTGSPRDRGRAFEQDIDGTNSTVVPSISPGNHSKPSGSSTDSDGSSRGSSMQSSFEPQSTTETESTTGRYSGPFASLDRVDDEAARALESIGIDSIKALSEVDTIEIGNKLDRSPNTVARWREEANELNH